MCCQDKCCIFVNISIYCQHGSFSFTLTRFMSYSSAQKKTRKKNGVLPHGVRAPRSHCVHTMHDFVCACVVASQGRQHRDEGLHSACLPLTWLRKTALGFAPRGREDCAISWKKYSRSADFCHKTPVGKTQLWPTANCERKSGAWKITNTLQGCNQSYYKVDVSHYGVPPHVGLWHEIIDGSSGC